jgi:hypothetical protein
MAWGESKKIAGAAEAKTVISKEAGKNIPGYTVLPVTNLAPGECRRSGSGPGKGITALSNRYQYFVFISNLQMMCLIVQV